MASVVSSLFAGLLKLTVVAGLALYAGLVLMSYQTDGPHCPPRLTLGDPVRSAVRLLVWLGVKLVAAVLRVGTPLLNMLAEASAEVGEWFIRRRDPEVQAAFRSRFMV